MILVFSRMLLWIFQLLICSQLHGYWAVWLERGEEDLNVNRQWNRNSCGCSDRCSDGVVLMVFRYVF